MVGWIWGRGKEACQCFVAEVAVALGVEGAEQHRHDLALLDQLPVPRLPHLVLRVVAAHIAQVPQRSIQTSAHVVVVAPDDGVGEEGGEEGHGVGLAGELGGDVGDQPQQCAKRWARCRHTDTPSAASSLYSSMDTFLGGGRGLWGWVSVR